MIADEAFHDCASLQRMTIPASVTRIGRMAFYRCPSLNSLIEDATTPPENDNALGLDAADLKILVPAGSDPASGKSYVDIYRAAPGWSDYSSEIISQ